ncbi:MAG: tyrosine-type recombinase/integrase [Fermentimonas sp.]|nr:tyrosine-type recombinase/integrase [Fermentimonas sp.]
MRKVNPDVLKSIFADEMRNYLSIKVSHGFQMTSYFYQLKIFDQFCIERGITSPVLTMKDAHEWIQIDGDEGDRRYCNRLSIARNFLIYLNAKNYDIAIPDSMPYKRSDFKPHIYTDDETSRYFKAIDRYYTARAKVNSIQFPVMFRLFYCCGTRLNETLGIQLKDINLKEGTIRLRETKNHKERYIVLGDDLLELMIAYADKYFYQLDRDDYIFNSGRGSRYSKDRIYTVHRETLQYAGIPYHGDKEGPRIHDWRHTFAVKSFKRMIDSGMDMYASLPILSTYLGHKNIYDTEKYLRLTMSIYPYIEEKCKYQMEAVFGIRERGDFR